MGGECIDDVVIGYDETNNGKVPEVHVLTYSRDKVLGHRLSNTLPKIRKTNQRGIEEVLETNPGVDFHFVVLYRKFLNRIRGIDNGFTLLANKYSLVMMNVIAHMEEEHSLNTSKVFLDGLAQNVEINMLADQGLFRKPKFYAAGDQHIPIVNIADRIAYIFYNELINKGMMNGPVLTENSHRRVWPNIPDELLRAQAPWARARHYAEDIKNYTTVPLN